MRGTIIGMLGFCVVALVACESDEESDGVGGAGAGSQGGTSGSVVGDGGTPDPGAGAGGASGGAGGAACECEEEGGSVTLSLECACEAGLCHGLEEELEIVEGYEFAAPYYVRLGSCESGITAIEWDEGTEQSGSLHFDSQGRMIYAANGGYQNGFGLSGPRPYDCPEIGLGGYSFGSRTELSDCRWCLVEADDFPITGAGGEGNEPYYDHGELDLPECELGGDGMPLPPER